MSQVEQKLYRALHDLFWRADGETFIPASAGNTTVTEDSVYHFSTRIARLVRTPKGKVLLVVPPWSTKTTRSRQRLIEECRPENIPAVTLPPSALKDPVGPTQWVTEELRQEITLALLHKSVGRKSDREHILKLLQNWNTALEYGIIKPKKKDRDFMAEAESRILNGTGKTLQQELILAKERKASREHNASLRRKKKLYDAIRKLRESVPLHAILHFLESYDCSGDVHRRLSNMYGEMWKDSFRRALCISVGGHLVHVQPNCRGEYEVQTSSYASVSFAAAKLAIRQYYAGKLKLNSVVDRYIVKDVTETQVHIGCHVFVRAVLDDLRDLFESDFNYDMYTTTAESIINILLGNTNDTTK